MADSDTIAPPARPVTPTPAYTPSPLGGVATTGAPAPIAPPPKPTPTGAYSPSDIKSSFIRNGASPGDATTLTAITGAESGFGKSPVSPPNKDGSRDYGVAQINNKAWPQFGGAAIASQPLDVQTKAALHIWNTQGPNAWTTYKNGAYRAHLGQVDSTKTTGSPLPAGSVPSATPAGVPPPPVGVGGVFGALNAPGASGKSTMDNLGSEFGGEQQPPANLPNNLQGQQAAASGNIRQQQIYQESQPEIQAMAHAAAPPTGTPTRPNTVAYFGGQPIPVPANLGLPNAIGTTLNSQGSFYGQ